MYVVEKQISIQGCGVLVDCDRRSQVSTRHKTHTLARASTHVHALFIVAYERTHACVIIIQTCGRYSPIRRFTCLPQFEAVIRRVWILHAPLMVNGLHNLVKWRVRARACVCVCVCVCVCWSSELKLRDCHLLDKFSGRKNKEKALRQLVECVRRSPSLHLLSLCGNRLGEIQRRVGHRNILRVPFLIFPINTSRVAMFVSIGSCHRVIATAGLFGSIWQQLCHVTLCLHQNA